MASSVRDFKLRCCFCIVFVPEFLNFHMPPPLGHVPTGPGLHRYLPPAPRKNTVKELLTIKRLVHQVGCTRRRPVNTKECREPKTNKVNWLAASCYSRNTTAFRTECSATTGSSSLVVALAPYTCRDRSHRAAQTRGLRHS